MHKKIIIKMLHLVARSLYEDDLLRVCNFIELKKVQCIFICADTILALRAAEDKRFFYHCGFDILAIMRALAFWFFKKIQTGASTIDQQLIRTITQEKHRTIKRKIKEIILAAAINNKFQKIEIATAYLNSAYYGWNMHGIMEATSRIVKENIIVGDDINYMLISLLKYPLSRYPSGEAIKRIDNRSKYIKNRIKIVGFS